jgi:hypothetical protein
MHFRLGNTTRHNPKARTFPNFSENYSLAKSFVISESKRIDFRWEAFNMFNRSRFVTGSRNIDYPNLGRVLDTINDPRRMQFALKFYF